MRGIQISLSRLLEGLPDSRAPLIDVISHQSELCHVTLVVKKSKFLTPIGFPSLYLIFTK